MEGDPTTFEKIMKFLRPFLTMAIGLGVAILILWATLNWEQVQKLFETP